MSPVPATPGAESRRDALVAWGALVVVGLLWGATQPLSKFGMDGTHHALGVTLWQSVVGALACLAVLAIRRERLPLGRAHLRLYAICGLIGTALPATLSLTSIQHLPVGVQSIVLSSVPLSTLLIALPFGLDRAEPRRLAGLALGALGVVFLVAPETSLPDPAQAVWIALPVIVSLCYASENIVLARLSPPGISPIQVLAGLMIASAAMLTPVVLATGTFAWTAEPGWREVALTAIGLLHVSAYTGLVWLISRAGPVFASQVGYVVTASAVVWGIVFYAERPSPWVWAALVATFAGVALVRPRQRSGRTAARA